MEYAHYFNRHRAASLEIAAASQDTGSVFDGWKEALDGIFGRCSCPHIAEDALEGVQGDREDLVSFENQP